MWPHHICGVAFAITCNICFLCHCGGLPWNHHGIIFRVAHNICACQGDYSTKMPKWEKQSIFVLVRDKVNRTCKLMSAVAAMVWEIWLLIQWYTLKVSYSPFRKCFHQLNDNVPTSKSSLETQFEVKLCFRTQDSCFPSSFMKLFLLVSFR